MYDFSSVRNIKAVRKEHQCSTCGHSILAGQPAFYFAGKFEGDFWSGHIHSECRAAEVDLNHLAGTYGDEWQSIQDPSYLEVEDREWLLAEHPIVAERLGIREPVQ